MGLSWKDWDELDHRCWLENILTMNTTIFCGQILETDLVIDQIIKYGQIFRPSGPTHVDYVLHVLHI